MPGLIPVGVAVVAWLALGCGGAPVPAAAPSESTAPDYGALISSVRSVPMTATRPPRVRDACRRARRLTRVEVPCPPIVPDVPIVRSHRLWGGYRLAPRHWEITFNNGDNQGTIHWLAGGGPPKSVGRFLLDDEENVTKGKPRLVRRVRGDGRTIGLYLYPRDAGGPNTGHVAAFAKRGDAVVYASVHGARHSDAVVAMVRSMLAVAPRAG